MHPAYTSRLYTLCIVLRMLAAKNKIKRAPQGFRRTALSTAMASAAMAVALTGCTKVDTTSPSSAREDAASVSVKTQAKLGTVDCRKAKCVALTFDAGPSENSPRLLDILKEEKVPAVPGIIDALKKRGYVFVTVPQLLAPGKAEPGKVYRP